MIDLNNVTFAYKSGTAVFERFTWRVAAGESWAVIGPSGCGKTTLLYLISGLYSPSSGSITVAGESVPRKERGRTGLILQDYGLLPWATVWDNAALGLRIRRFYGPDGKHAPADEDPRPWKARVDEWLQRLNIAHLAQQYPGQISGGQRQRTAIARTLALAPDLLLMDEPFGALDAMTREDLQALTLELQAEQGLTTVVVTHNIEEALVMGRKILVLGQPPQRKAVIVETLSDPQPGRRFDETFLARCDQLRALLGESTDALA